MSSGRAGSLLVQPHAGHSRPFAFRGGSQGWQAGQAALHLMPLCQVVVPAGHAADEIDMHGRMVPGLWNDAGGLWCMRLMRDFRRGSECGRHPPSAARQAELPVSLWRSEGRGGLGMGKVSGTCPAAAPANVLCSRPAEQGAGPRRLLLSMAASQPEPPAWQLASLVERRQMLPPACLRMLPPVSYPASQPAACLVVRAP